MSQRTSPLERIEAQSFRRQQSAFCGLTMILLAALLVLHTSFATLLGEPSRSVIILLGGGFFVKAAEWYWISRQVDGISSTFARAESAFSIVFLFLLAWSLAVFTHRDDAPYFVLLAVAILQCAYHFGLLLTILTVSASIAMMFGWAIHFFAQHPPTRPTEFVQCGMISVIYGVMGLLVWNLVKQLNKKETKLFQKMAELELTRERLAREEKLAAVGRLASGIAHEIRNPVAMIASSLATVRYPNVDPGEREEMFVIAEREAKRLESLTTDFLAYARPSLPQVAQVQLAELLDHIARIAQVRTSEAAIQLTYVPGVDLVVSIDPFQMEGALINLVLNAVAATDPGGHVIIRSLADGHRILFEVEDSGERIDDGALERIFEPFFTTKKAGTGLGLAIARGVARAHGGDLWVSRNDNGAVVFTMSISVADPPFAVGENTFGKTADRWP